MNLIEEQLSKQLRPMILRGWNLNHDEKALDVDVSFAYFPKEYDGSNPPVVRYSFWLVTGRHQERHNCSKSFVEMIDCITKNVYERMIGLDS